MTDKPTDAHVILEGSRAAPGEGREFVLDVLAAASERTVTVALLVVSELVTTAVRHGSPRVALSVQRADHVVRIEVAEQTVELDKAPDAAIEPVPQEEWSSRILDALADRHGQEMRSDGMATWAEIDVPLEGL